MSWPFLRLYLLTLLYFSANSILNVIIPLKGETLGMSNTAIGVMMGAYLFTTMLLRPWAGNLIARYGAVPILRMVLVINGLALVLYAVTGIGGYFAARVMQGACTAFFSMTLQLGIIDALPEKERSQGISMYSLCSYLPGMIGPLLAIGIWQSGEMNSFGLTMLAIAVLTGLVGYSAKIESKPADAAQREPVSQESIGTRMAQSFGQLIANPHLRKSSLLMLGASLVFGAVTAFMPLYAMKLAGGSAALYLAIQAAVVVAGRFALRKRIPSDGKWHAGFMAGAMLMLTLAALCISQAAWGGAVLLYIGALLMGLAQAVLYPSLTTYLSFVLPANNRNVLIGLFIATADMGVSLGGVVMGPIADVSSFAWMYGVCAALGAVLVAVSLERRSLVEHHKSNNGEGETT